jgi:hypothetical protein
MRCRLDLGVVPNKITTFYTHNHSFCSHQLAETKVEHYYVQPQCILKLTIMRYSPSTILISSSLSP